jgi:hypothetical protein
MGRKATAIQKAAARKLKLRTTKTVRGKLIPLDAETLKKRIAAAKLKVAKKKVAAKKKATSKRIIKVSGDRSADSRVAAKKAGQRTAKKYAKIKYKKKDPKTGKISIVTVRRKNATSHNGKYITPTSGSKYTERRSDRSDKGKFI